MTTDHKARQLQAIRPGLEGPSPRNWGWTENFVRLLVALTVMVALLEGFFIVKALRMAGTRLSDDLEPAAAVAVAPIQVSRPAPAPQPSGPAPLARFGREPTDSDRQAFSEASYLAGSLGPPTYERVLARVREFYFSSGIKDDEFIALNALDEAERGYQDALLDAQGAYLARDAAGALDRLESALREQDPRHLVARLRLLESIEVYARESRKPGRARQAAQETAALREQILALTDRALSSAKGGKAAQPASAQEALEHWKRDERARSELLESLSGDGTLMNLMANLFKLAGGRER